MRTPLIAGNWKMHKTIAESERFISGLLPLLYAADGVEVGICVPYTDLQAMVDSTRGSRVEVYAQNMHEAPEGAFTGEISASMLNEIDVHGVVLGHSERRQYDNETNEKVAAKAIAAVGYHLRPIVCVGETLTQREAGETTAIIDTQIHTSLAGFPVDQIEELVVAYEPVWAIGTGKVATPTQANQVHQQIRKLLVKMFGDPGAAIRIIYGGSVKPENAADLMAEPDIDGALVGGASLDARAFFDIIEATRPARPNVND